MKPALPILATLAAVMVLSGCGMANEAPCRDFEAAYNEADLRDKYNQTKPSGKEFGPSLERLAAVSRAAAEGATGDVEKHLWGVVNGYSNYDKYGADIDDWHFAMNQWQAGRDGLIEACAASGYPIQLESDYRPR